MNLAATLGAGLVHDLNNALTVVLATAGASKTSSPMAPRPRRSPTFGRGAPGGRAHQSPDALRPPAARRAPTSVDLRGAVKEVEGLLRVFVGRGIDLTMDLDRPIVRALHAESVRADPREPGVERAGRAARRRNIAVTLRHADSAWSYVSRMTGRGRRGDPQSPLRALLHDEGRRQGNRARAGVGQGPRRAGRGSGLRREPRRKRTAFHVRPAQRGERGGALGCTLQRATDAPDRWCRR